MACSNSTIIACFLTLLVAAFLVAQLPSWSRHDYSSSVMKTVTSDSDSQRQSVTAPVPDAMQAHNVIEEAKLLNFLTRERPAVNGVIVILATSQRLDTLLDSLNLLYRNFNNRFCYPLVIFHEADFLPVLELVRRTGFIDNRKASTIFFQHVELKLPEWHLEKFGKPPNHVCSAGTIGYRHMCRFQAKLMYEQPVMRHFSHYLRLDDDSKITAPVGFDVFKALTTGGFSYGYYESNLDGCAHDLWNVTEEYIRSRAISPTFFRRLKRNEIFFNNFEVSSLQFWRSKSYREFMDHIDSLGGIYKHRWGDAPIKTLALSLHIPLREIYRYSNVSYRHGNVKDRTKTDFLP